MVRHPLPDLEEVTVLAELCSLRASDFTLLPHVHPDLEVHYIERGNLRWWVGDRWYEVTGGDLFLIQPQELHGGYHGQLEPCRLYSLQVHLPDDHHRLGLGRDEAIALGQKLTALVSQPYRGSTGVRQAWRTAMTALDQLPDPVAAIEVRCSILEVLTFLARADRRPWQHRTTSTCVVKARRILDAAFRDPPSVLELAEAVGSSPSYLKARFRDELGVPPWQYLIYTRVQHACRSLLQTDEPITAIAHDAGFYSSQHFAQRFKAATGLTPTAYRLAARREADALADGRLPLEE